VRSATDSRTALAGDDAFTDGEDGTRYTVPYKINTRYWLQSGGALFRRLERPLDPPHPGPDRDAERVRRRLGVPRSLLRRFQNPEEADVKNRYASKCP